MLYKFDLISFLEENLNMSQFPTPLRTKGIVALCSSRNYSIKCRKKGNRLLTSLKPT